MGAIDRVSLSKDALRAANIFGHILIIGSLIVALTNYWCVPLSGIRDALLGFLFSYVLKFGVCGVTECCMDMHAGTTWTGHSSDSETARSPTPSPEEPSAARSTRARGSSTSSVDSANRTREPARSEELRTARPASRGATRTTGRSSTTRWVWRSGSYVGVCFRLR